MTLSSLSHRTRAAEHIFKTLYMCIPFTEIVMWAELPSGSGTRLDPLEASAGNQVIIYLQCLQSSLILALATRADPEAGK